MTLTSSAIPLVIAIASLAGSASASGILLNVTDSVFGSHLGVLPVAFGDFNGDKLTDMVVVEDGDRNKISVLIANKQNTFSLTEGKYFKVAESVSGLGELKKLSCVYNQFTIVAAAPADFDGDGGMDVLIVAKDDDEKLVSFVAWGEHHRGENGAHALVCPEKAIEQKWHHLIHVGAEPLVIEGNGDAIADVFGLDENNTRGIWIFGRDRTQKPEFSPLGEGSGKPFRRPHSNAFVDLNNDGNSDILVTTEGGFEMWENKGTAGEPHFQLHQSHIEAPDCDGPAGSKGPCVGQSVFGDFDLDGRLDMVFPVCQDGCKTGILYWSPLMDLWKAKKSSPSPFLVIPLDLKENYEYDPTAPDSDFYPGMSPRMGDINLDGYPDLLLRVKNKRTNRKQTHLLLNIDAEDSPANQRGFAIQPQVMSDLNDTVMAAFYDLYEDGTNDVITVQTVGEEGRSHRVGAFTNATQDSDAYFAKIIVLSGICYLDCANDSVSVPYGTNLPGQTICYRTQRQVAESFSEVQSCAAQLPQTAHHALQLPYTIFGLGLAPNFLDFVYVNVTNTSAVSQSKIWPQIIPNSQVYIIPYPTNQPSLWEAKLFITPGRSITLTGVALLATCFLVGFIIVMLHAKEKRQDRKEMMQDARRFHFDAM